MSAAWFEMAEPPALREGAIHVFRADLDLDPFDAAHLDRARALLSPDERERSDRFLIEHARRRFTIARAHLRRLLAGYLAVPPGELVFTYGPRGKPRLEGARLRFNVSHSRERALFAFTLDREIGVDLEKERAVPDALAIAEHMFARAERERLAAVPAADRAAAFLRCWTRKEAFVKATGDGLGTPLDAFEVTFASAHEPARFESVEGRAEATQPFRLADLAPGHGWHAALCSEGPCESISLFAAPRA